MSSNSGALTSETKIEARIEPPAAVKSSSAIRTSRQIIVLVSGAKRHAVVVVGVIGHISAQILSQLELVVALLVEQTKLAVLDPISGRDGHCRVVVHDHAECHVVQPCQHVHVVQAEPVVVVECSEAVAVCRPRLVKVDYVSCRFVHDSCPTSAAHLAVHLYHVAFHVYEVFAVWAVCVFLLDVPACWFQFMHR